MEEKEKNLTQSLTKQSGLSNCYFSESTFLRVMGPGPSFEERLRIMASRPRTQEVKKKIKVDFDRSIFNPISKSTTKPKSGEAVKVNNDESLIEIHNHKAKMMEGKECGIKNYGSQMLTRECKDISVEDERKEMSSESDTLEHSSNMEIHDANLEKSMLRNSEILKKQNVGEIYKDTATIDTRENTFLKDDANQVNAEADILTQEGHQSEGEKSSESIGKCNMQLIMTDCKEVGERTKGRLDSEMTVREKCPIISPKKSKDLSATDKEDEDDVCCLILPNPSDEDDDSCDESITGLISSGQGTNKNSSTDKVNIQNVQSKPSTTVVPEQKSEEPFCLVMPDISSDEQSSKDDIAEYYRRNSLITSTNPAVKSKNPDIPNCNTNQLFSGRKELPNSPPMGVKLDSTVPSVSEICGAKETGNTEICHANNMNDDNAKDPEQLPKTDDGVTSSAGPSTHSSENKEQGKIYKNLRSKLSKKQHKRYIQLYKRHVCPMMKGNRKAVYSDAELKELVELEELQQHVSQEQGTYQDYLKSKALRNPQAYNFIQKVSRFYAHSRYNSYHKPRNHIRNYEVDGFLSIPLVLEDRTASSLMTFHKTLLKVGSSPRINLPDVKDGVNPVQIKVDPTTMNTWFPSCHQNSSVKSMDHKMMSEDTNAIKLAEEEEVDVVLSSSSFKCLLDNHASDVMKAWDIPVTVSHVRSSGMDHKTIYLDKPLFRDDVPVRDFNAMYHKYALRTFVSRPRGQGINRIQPNILLNKREQRQKIMEANRQNSIFTAEDLDIFSTETVNDIETFGSFSGSKAFSSHKHLDTSPTLETQVRDKGETVIAGVESDIVSTQQSPITRSSRLSQSDNTISENCSIFTDQNSITTTSVTASISSNVENTALNSSSLEVKQSNQKILRRSTRLSESLESVTGKNPSSSSNQKSDSEPPLKVAKTDADIDAASLSTESSLEEPKRRRGRYKNSGSSNSQTELDARSKSLNSESAMETESPASPPMMDLQSPSSPSKTIEVPLSPVGKDSSSHQNKNGSGLLDSILGPSDFNSHTDNCNQDRNNPLDINNTNEFLPLSEKCNSVTYNLWELGSLKLLLRCNYHGSIKDKNKARYVYLSPKMEYQSDFGMEQVTLNEMTRAWTSCFIRPCSSFIRARINAFTSEILMIEEKSIDGILNPALPFKPDHSFAVLKQLFEQLRSLPEGNYLLSHQKGNKFCKVRKFHGRASLMRAPKKKKTGRAKEGQVPWIPIDTTILTPTHINNARIPGTFMPSDWEMPVKKNPPGGGDNKNKKQGQGGWKGRNQNNTNQGHWNKQKQQGN